MKKLIYTLMVLLLPIVTIGQIVSVNNDQNNAKDKAAITWDGSTDNDWQTTTNWTPENIPTEVDDVTIPNSLSNYPVIDDGATVALCNDLSIGTTASLTIANNGRLTVSGTLTNSAGNSGITIQSDATGTGSLRHSTASINGTVEMFLSGTQWHYISTPIEGVNSSEFNTLNFKRWDATAEWSGGTNTDPWLDFSATMANAQGYANYESQNTTTLTGVLHQGTYNVSVFMSTGTTQNQGWNLIGNPYICAIDWENVDYTSANLDDAIYFYNGTTYASWVGGAGQNGGTQYIPQGQGFFVKCNNTSGGTLTFNNDDRVHNSQSFWKEDEQKSEIIRLIAQGNSLNDETVIRFIEGATYEFDGEFDAYKLISPNPDVPQLYSLDSAKITLYSINSLPEITEEVAIPLGFLVTPAGSYSISSTEMSTDVRYVLLEDVVEDTVIDLRKYPTYIFNFPGGENNDRFILRIKPNSAPTVANPIGNIDTNEDENFNYTFPADVFEDTDNDSLIYTATLDDSSPLPAWLEFDGETRTFSGLPENDDVGIWPISLKATDTYWADVTCFFDITVINTNDAPVVDNPIADQVTYVGDEWNFTFPDNVFSDVDEGDILTYSASLTGGADLPVWLVFNPAERNFTGTPPEEEVLNLTVTAADGLLEEISDDFLLYAIHSVNIDNIAGIEFLLYPNPSNGIITFEIDNNKKEPLTVEIFDISGQKTLSRSYNSGKSKETIDFSYSAKGIYNVKISSESKTVFRKLILMKK